MPLVSLDPGDLFAGAACGDLDGDGRSDVVIDTLGRGLLVSRGLRRSLAAPVPASEAGPGWARLSTLIDLDGDGRLDALRIDSTAGEVQALGGRGDGTFDAPVVSDFGADHWAGLVGVADVDGDGLDDLVVRRGWMGDFGLSVMRGLPGGRAFAAGARVAELVDNFQADLADVNGDACVDLVAFRDARAMVYFGDCAGGFVPGPQTMLRLGISSFRVIDLDRDGRPDITGLYGAALQVARGRGDGGFDPPQGYDVGSYSIFDVSWADLDRDGLPDAVLRVARGLTVLRGAESGFTQPILYPVGWHGPINPCDVDGDGWLDLVLEGEGVKVVIGDGKGGLAGPTALPPMSHRGLALADLNGDAALDLALADHAGVTVLAGDGRGGYAETGSVTWYGPVNEGAPIAVADLDDDGRDDLVGAFGVLKMVGWSAGATAPWTAELRTSAWSSRVVALDLDRDGLVDLVVDSPPDLQWLRAFAPRSYSPPVRLAASTSPSYNRLLVGDVDGDGWQDLLFAKAEGGGHALHVFRSASGAPSPEGVAQLGVWASALRAGDMNGDGRDDLVVVSDPADSEPRSTPSELLVFLSGVGGGFAQPLRSWAPRAYADRSRERTLALADIDRDGHLDVVASASWVLFGAGDGGVRDSRAWDTGQGAPFAIGDLDGDGWLDVVAAHGFSATSLTALFGDCSP